MTEIPWQGNRSVWCVGHFFCAYKAFKDKKLYHLGKLSCNFKKQAAWFNFEMTQQLVQSFFFWRVQTHIFQSIQQLNHGAASHKPVSLTSRRQAIKWRAPPPATKAAVNHPVSFGISLKYATETHAATHSTALLAVYTSALIGAALTRRACRGHLITRPDIYFHVSRSESAIRAAAEQSETAAQLINCSSSQLGAHAALSWVGVGGCPPLPQILLLIIVTTDKRGGWEKKRDTILLCSPDNLAKGSEINVQSTRF